MATYDSFDDWLSTFAPPEETQDLTSHVPPKTEGHQPSARIKPVLQTASETRVQTGSQRIVDGIESAQKRVVFHITGLSCSNASLLKPDTESIDMKLTEDLTKLLEVLYDKGGTSVDTILSTCTLC